MDRNSAPLTLNELLKRQGKPVWIHSTDPKSFTGWAIFHSMSSGGAFLQFNAGCNTLYTSDYNRTWYAYDYEREQQKKFYSKPDFIVVPGEPQKLTGATTVRIESDYAPGTFLYISRTDDGDIVLKISGPGEMRIATSGGQFHGKDLLAVTGSFDDLIAFLYAKKAKQECLEEKED